MRDRKGGTMTTTDHPYQIDDVHRRIRNILNACPATSWSLEESRTVLDVVAGILRDRQAVGSGS
jgi:hypothetical protein